MKDQYIYYKGKRLEIMTRPSSDNKQWVAMTLGMDEPGEWLESHPYVTGDSEEDAIHKLKNCYEEESPAG
jgi:hypothetical protein